MTTMTAWFNSRPFSAPTSPPPASDRAVLAVASSVDGCAETRIVRMPEEGYSFEVEAWTNFEDAGGNPHLAWHTFHPQFATRTQSLEAAVQLAEEDAKERGLSLRPMQWLSAEGREAL